MFKDILGPRGDHNNEEQMQDDYGQDEKHGDMSSPCTWDCECDNCLEEAIKDLADQIGFDLENEDIENIKIEYHNNKYGSFEGLLTVHGKLTIVMKKHLGKHWINNNIKEVIT